MHGTAVARAGDALLICGPPGAGKSGLAAQTIAMGFALVSDDLCILHRDGDTLRVAPPPDAPVMLELRGIGIVAVPTVPDARLVGVLDLTASAERLPPPDAVRALGVAVPLLRHPYRFDAAAKAVLWLAGAA